MATPAAIARFSRRRLLQVGSVGALGLTLTDLLARRAGASPGPAGGPVSGSERSCIFIVQYGGASHIDSLDLKPAAPADIRGPFAPIATNVPGIEIGQHLPRLARMADRWCLVRSMTHANGGHDGGMHVAMTGHANPVESTPYLGSVVARLRPSLRNIPSYVWLQNLAGDVLPWYLTGGFLGPAYAPLRVGTDLDNPAAEGFRFSAFDPPADVSTEQLVERDRLRATLEAPSRHPAVEAPSFDTFRKKAVELVTGTEARRAFDLSQEEPALRDRYGRHPLGQNLLMARRLIESGVRLVNVTAWMGVAPGESFTNVQTWDMHGPGAAGHLGSIFGDGTYGLGYALPRLDEAVAALLDDLHHRGLLESTLVVVVGEFGRSPKINNLGRDHWPACYTSLLAGAGIRGGTVYGSSDATGAFVKDHPVPPEDFHATLLHSLGIHPDARLGLEGFTRPASTGTPVDGLLA
jgi:hypothetical protein